MKRKNGWPPDGMGFIYALTHPITGDIKYIGQTLNGIRHRLKSHIFNARYKKKKTPVNEWVSELALVQISPNVIVLECAKIEELNEREVYFINDGRIKYNLLNIQDGGFVKHDRKRGFKQSKEFCDRQSRERSGVNSPNFIDITGRRYNGLTVIGLYGFEDCKSKWLCQCDCGNTKVVVGHNLNRTKTCGCSKKKMWTEEKRRQWSELTKNRKIDAVTKRFMA